MTWYFSKVASKKPEVSRDFELLFFNFLLDQTEFNSN